VNGQLNASANSLEHYLDLIDIALADKKRVRSIVKRAPDGSGGPHQLLQDMDISHG
jgi:hypothetical protein